MREHVNIYLIKMSVSDDDQRGKSSYTQNPALTNVFRSLLQYMSVQENEGSGEVHSNIFCIWCKNSSYIRGDRYKCLECENFDLCAKCFERRVELGPHKSGHTFAHFRLPNELLGQKVAEGDVTWEKLTEFYQRYVHHFTTCDGCQKVTMVGLRFKCDQCPKYDLCQQCVLMRVMTKSHKPTHSLVLAWNQMLVEISVDDIEKGRRLGNGAFGKLRNCAPCFRENKKPSL